MHIAYSGRKLSRENEIKKMQLEVLLSLKNWERSKAGTIKKKNMIVAICVKKKVLLQAMRYSTIRKHS